MLPRPALGARRARPVVFNFQGVGDDRIEELKKLPGVRWQSGYRALVGWDAAKAAGRILGQPAPPEPKPSFLQTTLPGLAKYLELGFKTVLRGYQKEAVEFLVHRAGAILADDTRAGKSLVALVSALLLGARKVLILCPAIAKLGWAEEIAKWFKKPSTLLYGRGADEVRIFCEVCLGTGRIPPPAGAPDDTAPTVCRACKPKRVKGGIRGDRLFNVTTYRALPLEDVKRSCAWPYQPEPARCSKHQVIAPPPGKWRCPECNAAFEAMLDTSEFVIVNYDLLIAQGASTAAGKAYKREDLPGYAPWLAARQWDVAILDESHWLRGGRDGGDKRFEGRVAMVKQAIANADRVWAITATPIFGFLRDLFSQLDLVSGSTWGSRRSFEERYCDGHKGEYAWEADGMSALGETELVERLKTTMLQRPREVIWSELPPKQRIIKRLDADVPLKIAGRTKPNGDKVSMTKAAMAETFAIKLPHVLDALVEDILLGKKAVAYVYNPDSTRKLLAAIEAELKKPALGPRLRRTNPIIWCVNGDDTSPDARKLMAREFVAHKGAAVFIATIDSMPGSVSLKGAEVVYFIDHHWSPLALRQAEGRVAEYGCKVQIVHYIVKGSLDEHIVDIIIPRLDMVVKVMGDSEAEQTANALRLRDPSELETLEQIWARMTQGVDDDVGEISNYSEDDS